MASTTLDKALYLNQDTQVYGTFAEIGAGQEVARFFFQAGKASQTIAKTISAYDMIYSDEIYGKEKTGRYVCESRLNKMLDKEYSLLLKRLAPIRGKNTTFFAFANTVATGDQKKRFSHGWMGVRFQLQPNGPVNDVILHVRLTDSYRLMQQEALGVLGVNLIYSAFNRYHDEENFIPSLVENIKPSQVRIDMVKVSGPDFEHFNNHLLNLELVGRNWADAVLFGADRSILNLSDEVWGKSLLIQRGMFRPITVTHVDVFEKGKSQLEKELKKSTPILTLCEMNMETLQTTGEVSEKDFLDRVTCISAIGLPVLVSNFKSLIGLKNFLRQNTMKPIVLIMGASHLDALMDQERYVDYEGGILEGMGKLFSNDSKVYVYPHKTPQLCMTAQSFNPRPDVAPIYKYLLSQEWIEGISGCEESGEYVHSKFVAELIKKKDSKWKALVPAKVRELIEKNKFFV